MVAYFFQVVSKSITHKHYSYFEAWITEFLLSVLERYYDANKHRFGMGCRCKVDSALSALHMTVEKFLCTRVFFMFLGYLWFWTGNIKVARWNGLEIMIPKHMWKSKIGLLEEIWAQNPYVTFFLGHPVYGWSIVSCSHHIAICSQIYIQGDPKKCHIRILSSNLF